MCSKTDVTLLDSLPQDFNKLQEKVVTWLMSDLSSRALICNSSSLLILGFLYRTYSLTVTIQYSDFVKWILIKLLLGLKFCTKKFSGCNKISFQILRFSDRNSTMLPTLSCILTIPDRQHSRYRQTNPSQLIKNGACTPKTST